MAETYGSHFPMRIRMELECVAVSKRLPGMPTCNIAMETILGRDESIDFEDYLGDPRVSETAIDFRAVLEKKHGLLPRSKLQRARVGGPPLLQGPLRAGVAMAKRLGEL
jgi:hypothetical protein